MAQMSFDIFDQNNSFSCIGFCNLGKLWIDTKLEISLKTKRDFYLMPDILTHNKKHANINKINQQKFNSLINIMLIFMN